MTAASSSLLFCLTFLMKNEAIWDESYKTLALKACKNSPFISVPSHTAFNLLLCFTGVFMAVVGGSTFLLSFVAPFFSPVGLKRELISELHF